MPLYFSETPLHFFKIPLFVKNTAVFVTIDLFIEEEKNCLAM
jgi:hypothetical protein